MSRCLGQGHAGVRTRDFFADFFFKKNFKYFFFYLFFIYLCFFIFVVFVFYSFFSLDH